VPFNRSLAIWCAPRPEAGPTTIEVHFNYWHIAGNEEFSRKAKCPVSDFAEIGVMLDNPEKIDRISIILPFLVAEDSIVDCSRHLAQPELAQGIFNEVLTTTIAASPARYVELNGNSDIFCRIHSFMKNDAGKIDAAELLVQSIGEGTLLTITSEALNEVSRFGNPPPRAYFRLRIYISDDAQNPLVRRIPTPDRLLQSGFNEIEYIDFRLNEARTLPPGIENSMRSDGSKGDITLKSVAFLIAVPVSAELSASSTQFHKLRPLEHPLWDAYVPSGIPEEMMVYHWRRIESDGIPDFSAFVKLETRRSGRRILGKYLLIAFLFGVLGNLAASAIQLGFAAGWGGSWGHHMATEPRQTTVPQSPGAKNK
jgi:hypothetical protein